MITVKTHSLVGTPSKTVWSQSQSAQFEETMVGVVLTLKNNGESDLLDLSLLGGAFLQKIMEDWEKSPRSLEWLMQAKDAAVEFGSKGISIDIIVYRIMDSKLMIWGGGEVGAFLIRNQIIANLGDGQALSLGVEGVVMENDVVLVMSRSAYEVIGLNTMSEILNSEFEESLAPLIYKGEQSAANVLQIIKVDEEKEQVAVGSSKAKWKIPGIKIQRMSEEPRKFNLIFGVLVVVGLLFLVGFGVIAKTKKQAETKYNDAKVAAEKMLSEAGLAAETNPERAKILLSQAKETLNVYIASKPKEYYLEQAKKELNRVETSEGDILKVKGIELRPTVELGLIATGLSSENIESDGLGNIYFWDINTKRFQGFNLKDASSTKYETKDVDQIGAFAIAKNGFFGVSNTGIWQGNSTEQKVVIPKDELWGEISQIGFFGSNVYLLDRGNGEIWKYAATADGYADRRRWFGAGVVLDLSKVVDWVVDGDIWLLTSSGKLERYSRGVPTKFELVGFPAMSQNGLLQNPSAVAVAEDKVYVLENGANRVVSFNVDGKYLAQYVSSDFARASDVVIFGGKGYVLVNNVVKEWEL